MNEKMITFRCILRLLYWQNIASCLLFGNLQANELMSADSRINAPRFALLVGVDNYPNLAPHEQLTGCVNDTSLIRRMLQERYGFHDSDIVTRTNEQATGTAIREEFNRLIERVRDLPAEAGTAQVVFHFSGHGSQIPDQPEGDPDCDELDGLDETLVPYDATRQGGSEDIRDDEVYQFVSQLCAENRARVWVILDCCHSGTGIRGATRFRALERGGVLPLNPDEQRERLVTPKRLPNGVVLLAACRANEKEPEYQEGQHSYGLLTRFLVQILNQQDAVSRLNYRALRESLEIHYRLAGISQAPTPQIEGQREAIVLNADSSLDRRPFWKVIPVGRERSSVTMAAGALHGVTVGSLYEIYERPDQIVERTSREDTLANGDSIGWVRIEKIDGLTAIGEVIGWDGGERVSMELPSGFREGYAIERHHAHGDFSLRVRVVRTVNEQSDESLIEPGDQSVPQGLRDAFAGGGIQWESESPWLRWASAEETFDVLIRWSDDYVAVFPATGTAFASGTQLISANDIPAALRGGWGPVDMRTTHAAVELQNILRQINRARNLIRVAALAPSTVSNGPKVKLELIAIEVDDRFKFTRNDPWPVTRDPQGYESLHMSDGSLYAVKVTNLEPEVAGKPIYVTVLHIDSDMGIHVLLPYEPGDMVEQRILPGEFRFSGPFQCNASDEIPVHGLRTAIVLATRQPNDFEILAQPSLPVTRSKERNVSMHSVLDELLIEQTYFRTRGGTTRLRPPNVIDESWSSSTIRWTVAP